MPSFATVAHPVSNRLKALLHTHNALDAASERLVEVCAFPLELLDLPPHVLYAAFARSGRSHITRFTAQSLG